MALHLRYFFIIYFAFTLLLKPAETESESPLINLNNADSEINLVLKENYALLFSIYYKDSMPSKIIINGEEDVFQNKVYDLKEEKNYITLKFNVQVKSCESMFSKVYNLLEVDISKFDMSQVTSMNEMFYHCYNLEYVNLTNIDISSVQSMSYLFYHCQSLTSIDWSKSDTNLININLSSVQEMDNLFSNCYSLISIDLSNIDFSNVKTVSRMFAECSQLTFINLTNIKLSSVENMNGFFISCINLTSIDLSNLDFSKVKDISYMFYGCWKLKYLNLSNINLSSVTTIFNLFSDTGLISIDLSNSDFSSVPYISNMFNKLIYLKYINLTNIKLSSVKQMDRLFMACGNLTSIDLSNLDFSNVKDISYMFSFCEKLKFINFTNTKLSSVEKMEGLFHSCINLTSIDLSNLDFSKVKDISNMFYGCAKLEYINLTNVKFSSVKRINNLFHYCNNLRSFDFQSFENSKINTMSYVFKNCISLKSVNFGMLDTSSVLSLEGLFSGCISLTSINLSTFDTSKVVIFSYMFDKCYNLTHLDLSNFDTSNAFYMEFMFHGCSNLLYLELSNFDTSYVRYIDQMFNGCKSLIYLNIYSFKLTDSVNKDFIFSNISSYIKYCINDSYTENLLGIDNNDCSHPCFKKNRKLDLYNKTCTELCINNKILYEYNNICYTKCPKGTFVNGPKCEDNSTDMNLISQEYYFDSNDELYKKCYDSCKSCNKAGNYKKHNCIECKYNFISFNDSIYETNCYKKCEYYYYFDDLNNYYHCTEKYECPEGYNKVILDKKKCINDCKKDDIYQYEFENKCVKECPENTFYNIKDKICLFKDNSSNPNDEMSENINVDDTINININLISSNDYIQTTNEISIKLCYKNCKECIDYSSDPQNMKCISCKNGFTMIFGTQNCVNAKEYPNYFIYLDYILPCSSLISSCYECDPFLSDNINDSCISCKPGYLYNNIIKRCETCKENEYPISIQKFDSCRDANFPNCELYTTYCIPLKNEEQEEICEKNNFNFYNRTCLISNKNKLLYINWLKRGTNNISYPSFNNDKSNYLLIELTLDLFKRKLYFYNEEGRGLFDGINDKYEMNVEIRRAYSRGISSSIAIKANNSEEYRYLLNLENTNNNFELIDIKTGELFIDNIFNYLSIFDYTFLDLTIKPTTFLLELNEQNKFLLATYARYRIDNKIVIFYFIFSLEDSTNQKINIDSLKKIEENILSFDNLNFNIYGKFYFCQTKKGNLYLSFVSEKNKLYYYDIQEKKEHFIYTLSNEMSFQKLLLIKDEIKFLSYISKDKYIIFLIFETINDSKDNIILEFEFKKFLPYQDNNDYVDIVLPSEVRAVFIWEKVNSITIFILNFFNGYKHFMKNEYLINIYGKGINNSIIYSLFFKYRNMLGLQFKNEKENGFILFGYYNSTDPNQILDVKKEGLFYNIKLVNYLNLQSNLFDYEIKCIRIIEVPNINISGLYLFSNITKNFIKKNDCVDINTKITLYFSYNGTLKKDNYLFKFVGVLQEPKYEIVQKNAVETFWNIRDISLQKKYIKEYNERRDTNITGRIAVVQINILNDIKVFCDKKYDEYAIKSKEGKLMACGEGKFYEVENANEITQSNLGKNYYFDKSKNYYIKCHEKCQTCSRKYNTTHMNCDLCIENFFIRNDNCLNISKCKYNYYYDKDLSLKCINKNEHCPDFKPYENIKTKECIQNCSLYEYNKECDPTNNKIAIKDTFKKILDNIKYLNLEIKLFIKKEKYIIYGNNVTFIFSTSEIEKKELNNNYNTSSIILAESEKYIKQYFSIHEEMPIPIFKIEILNNHSNDSELHYGLFNPENLSEKLDLNLLQGKYYIEIRKPKYLKEYKMDVILKTRDLGYNIFDLNDSFYNDICSVFSYNNTDFSLSERKNIIDLSDETLCLNIYNYSCNFSNFDIKTLRSICLCKIGSNDNYTSEIKKDYNNNEVNDLVYLVKQNMDISKSSNIKVVKCFSIIFRKNLLTGNYGFYIMFALLLINTITLIFSPISTIEKTFNEYCNEILSKMKIIYTKNNNINLQNENMEENENNEKNNASIIQNNTFPENKNANKNTKKKPSKRMSIINPLKISRKKSIKNKVKDVRILNLITSNDISKEKSDVSFRNNKMNNSDIILHKDKREEELIKKLKEKNNSDYYVYKVIKTIKPEKRKEYLSESEIENLSYKYALQIDDRNNSNYYFSLLKEKNKIISTFLNNDDYNILPIKISTFILEFVLSLTVNALFYSDEAIYEINQEKEDTSVISKYSRVIYSAIISGFLNYIIELLAFSKKKIIGLRCYKGIKDAEEAIPKIIKILKIKSIMYYILSLFLNVIFLYYITAFCAIYTIIQTHMISDAAISFLLTMSYTIILSLMSSIIRIFSLQKQNKFRYFLYIISWIISLI